MAILNVFLFQHIVAQKRGGQGIQGMGTNEDDFVEHLFTTILITRFCSLQTKEKYIVQKDMKFLNLDEQQREFQSLTFFKLKKENMLIRLFQLKNSRDDEYLFFLTKHGLPSEHTFFFCKYS